ncbi:MAG: dienelactone hydrolase family protein [Bacteroidota bacterium]
MKKLLPLVCLGLLFAFAGCQSGEKETSGDEANEKTPTEEFAENAKDENFKKSHETPKTKTNYNFTGNKIKFKTMDDQGIGYAYKLSASPASNDFLFVVHEWWGINENVMSETERLYKVLKGKVNVILVDLYDGRSTNDRDEASKFMQEVKTERCQSIVEGAIQYAGKDARIGTVGWCFGGGWSLQTAIAAKENGIASVIYYGMPETKADKLANLNAEVLGIFASEDKWITPKVVSDFESVMKAVGKTVTTKSFNADHAFANPSGERYDKKAAIEANALVDKFLQDKFL